MKQSKLTALWVTIIAVLALAGPLAAAPPRYICQDLSAPPDYIVSFANALSITGQVVGLGGFYADPLLVHRAFLKNYGQTMVDLGTLGGNAAGAWGINQSGQVVGFAYDAVGELGRQRAFLKNPGQPMVDLGTLGGSESWAYAINDLGQVVGHATDVANKRHAFQKNPGEPNLIDLGTWLVGWSEAYAINNLGQVVGSAGYGSQPGQTHAFLTKAGQPMMDLGTLAGGSGGRSDAHAINDAGQVVGEATDASGVVLRPFLKNPGDAMQDLDPLKLYYHGAAYGINQRGQIVGSMGLAQDYLTEHAFLWDKRVIYDLNDLTVNLPPGQVLDSATAINDRGWILASGSGVSQAYYLLIPRGVDVPLDLLLFN